MSKHSYHPPSIKNERQIKALEMAKARGEAAEEWLKTNTLTPETLPEFQRLMKQINLKSKQK